MKKEVEVPKLEKKRIVVPVGKEDVEKIDLADLKELQISKEDLKKLTKRRDKVKGGVKDIEYTVYESSAYGRIANSFFEGLSVYFIKKFPNEYKNLKVYLIKSDIALLSMTYVSVIFFTSLLAFFGVLIGSLVTGFFLGTSILTSLLRSISFAFLSIVATLFIGYYYPAMVARNRNRAIANDLPFVTIHMAAVSGSGAQPIAVFNLVLNSGEYKGLEKEIKKIVNYVNLFGYELTAALRSVSVTTPSAKFRELLTGIVSTLESGGDLKDYLKSKSDDALTSYRLDRRKYVESLATYSDIYTGVLIAAPLLFIATLAIINVLGGKICAGSFCSEASTLGFVGTFFIIPLLNVLFLLFLNAIQPEV